MSEYAKVAYLQEQISQAKRKWDVGAATSMAMFIAIGVCIALTGVIPNGERLWWHVPLFAGAMISAVYSARKGMKQYYGLVEQLKMLAYTRVTCARCKNEMPLGKYEFCPFCYNTLQTGTLS